MQEFIFLKSKTNIISFQKKYNNSIEWFWFGLVLKWHVMSTLNFASNPFYFIFAPLYTIICLYFFLYFLSFSCLIKTFLMIHIFSNLNCAATFTLFHCCCYNEHLFNGKIKHVLIFVFCFLRSSSRCVFMHTFAMPCLKQCLRHTML